MKVDLIYAQASEVEFEMSHELLGLGTCKYSSTNVAGMFFPSGSVTETYAPTAVQAGALRVKLSDVFAGPPDSVPEMALVVRDIGVDYTAVHTFAVEATATSGRGNVAASFKSSGITFCITIVECH